MPNQRSPLPLWGNGLRLTCKTVATITVVRLVAQHRLHLFRIVDPDTRIRSA